MLAQAGGSTDVAFVFPSGASTGAVHVGILTSLLEAGIFPDLMVGTSVGALNAAFMAADPSPARATALETVWLKLSRPDVFGRNRYGLVRRLIAGQSHIYTPAALRSLIARLCPIDDLSGGGVRLQVATTDLDLGVAKWWGSGPAAKILYASACLPGLFPPALLGGHRHVDGGVLEPFPVQRAVDLDASVVYVLGEPPSLDAGGASRMNALDVLIRSFEISRYSRLPEPAAVARPGQRVIVVPGADTSGIPITDFRHTGRLVRQSREISRKFLLSLSGSVADQTSFPAESPAQTATRAVSPG
ncbi:MAG TPA: patatin-like phospholipase family protein [Acidimicrobiales bacterium]|nr:patatin-like phospholipase family protein [Acidimicrobiales bacterium]